MKRTAFVSARQKDFISRFLGEENVISTAEVASMFGQYPNNQMFSPPNVIQLQKARRVGCIIAPPPPIELRWSDLLSAFNNVCSNSSLHIRVREKLCPSKGWICVTKEVLPSSTSIPFYEQVDLLKMEKMLPLRAIELAWVYALYASFRGENVLHNYFSRTSSRTAERGEPVSIRPCLADQKPGVTIYETITLQERNEFCGLVGKVF